MADSLQREFIKISQAVGVGFLIMGVIGYVVKLIHSTPGFLAMSLLSSNRACSPRKQHPRRRLVVKYILSHFAPKGLVNTVDARGGVRRDLLGGCWETCRVARMGAGAIIRDHAPGDRLRA